MRKLNSSNTIYRKLNYVINAYTILDENTYTQNYCMVAHMKFFKKDLN